MGCLKRYDAEMTRSDKSANFVFSLASWVFSNAAESQFIFEMSDTLKMFTFSSLSASIHLIQSSYYFTHANEDV